MELSDKLTNDFDQAFNWRERRHEEWTENYTLYRDRVIVNRLIQRQSVNIPLMKETIRTFLAGIDDAPDVFFEEKSNDKQKEIFLNGYWEYCYTKDKLELKDIVDKKQVGLFGRSFKKLNVINGRPSVEILDPQDVLVDRYTDPTDMDTAQFIIHIHIYRTLKELENNKDYDREAIKRLKEFFATDMGLIKANENYQSATDKNRKMVQMGVPDIDAPELSEVYVEINEHYRKIWEDDEWKIYFIVKANDEILMEKPLEEVIGKTKDNFWRTHYPINTWADDIERSDFWSDGLADIARTPNKIANAWFSQLVENRTLRSFGMNYYDSTNPKFVPQTFQPVPWGWYPLPGRPQDVIQRVDIPDLTDSFDEIGFVMNIVERSTAVTAIQKGVTERKQITLGEVQILAGKAQERIGATAKFYREAWKDLGMRWIKLVEAQGKNLESVKLFKKSFKGNMFEKEVGPKDWKSEKGYEVKVRSSAEQEEESMENIQKLGAVMAQMPGNQPLLQIYHRKLLDLAGLYPDEIKEVLEFQKMPQGILPAPEAVPAETPVPAEETERLMALRENIEMALAR